MKHEYERMDDDELGGLYFPVFGKPFFMNWDDVPSNHRQEIIDCIESGVPQDEGTIGGGWAAEDGVPGVDFAL